MLAWCHFNFQDILLQLLTKEEVKLNQIDARDPDIVDYITVPDIGYLSDRPLGCLEEAEEVPRDYMKLFEMNLFKLDNIALPTVSTGVRGCFTVLCLVFYTKVIVVSAFRHC